jgi:hypothetical protein
VADTVDREPTQLLVNPPAVWVSCAIWKAPSAEIVTSTFGLLAAPYWWLPYLHRVSVTAFTVLCDTCVV